MCKKSSERAWQNESIGLFESDLQGEYWCDWCMTNTVLLKIINVRMGQFSTIFHSDVVNVIAGIWMNSDSFWIIKNRFQFRLLWQQFSSSGLKRLFVISVWETKSLDKKKWRKILFSIFTEKMKNTVGRTIIRWWHTSERRWFFSSVYLTSSSF
jgi:hypothetical protein